MIRENGHSRPEGGETACSSRRRVPRRVQLAAGRSVQRPGTRDDVQESPMRRSLAALADAVGYEGHYTGHDEPSTLFYANSPGAGNNSAYRLVIPKDPPTLPNQSGTAGTFNFQNRIAFWFGMALCDNQSAPEFTNVPCTPDSDSNIFD